MRCAVKWSPLRCRQPLQVHSKGCLYIARGAFSRYGTQKKRHPTIDYVGDVEWKIMEWAGRTPCIQLAKGAFLTPLTYQKKAPDDRGPMGSGDECGEMVWRHPLQIPCKRGLSAWGGIGETADPLGWDRRNCALCNASEEKGSEKLRPLRGGIGDTALSVAPFGAWDRRNCALSGVGSEKLRTP